MNKKPLNRSSEPISHDIFGTFLKTAQYQMSEWNLGLIPNFTAFLQSFAQSFYDKYLDVDKLIPRFATLFKSFAFIWNN